MTPIVRCLQQHPPAGRATHPAPANLGQPVGRHAFIELHGCPVDPLSDASLARATIGAATIAAGAQLLQVIVHRFQPYGLTALGLLSESHISIHTWPERRFVAIDVFTCGQRCDPAAAYEVFVDVYRPTRHCYQEFARSVPPAGSLA